MPQPPAHFAGDPLGFAQWFAGERFQRGIEVAHVAARAQRIQELPQPVVHIRDAQSPRQFLTKTGA